MLKLQPLSARIGMQAAGVDVVAGVSDADLRQLVAALYAGSVLALRGQRLQPAEYVEFASRIGPAYIETYDNLQLPGHPALMQVGNVGPVLARKEFREGAGFWHTDRAYAADCDAITMLYCVKAMVHGGETLFADQHAAWETLDEDTRQRLHGVHGLHRYGAGELEPWETAVHPMSGEQAAHLPPPGRHPLARRHRVSGRTALYAVAGSCIGVEGMAEDAGRALLRSLKRHATAERFVYRHAWQPGDLLLWDNTATLHCAAPIPEAVDEASSRLLYRYVAMGVSPTVPQGVGAP